MLSLTLADPEDYLETIRLLTFRTGLRRVCTSLPIINDALLEDDESFYIMLTTADPLVLLNPRQGSVVIRSDDRKNGFIRESVDSLCRDGTDTAHAPLHNIFKPPNVTTEILYIACRVFEVVYI